MAALLHRAVDALAMWIPDRRARPPAPFREAPAAPLACFGPLPALPPPPPRAGTWRAPSPRPCPGDEWMEVRARPSEACPRTSAAPRSGAGEGRTPRGVAILVPPWKVPGLLAVGGYARLAARAGWDVWTVVPPRHLGRAAPGSRSGDGFVTPDLPATRAAFEQLVLELRVLVTLAAARGGESALVGVSLGALAAALAATAPERVDRVALLAPPADLSAVLAATPIGRRYHELAARAGAPFPSAAALAEMLHPFRPEGRAVTARAVLVAVGSEDRIALPGGALALARAWGVEPRRYPRGHITLLYACRALRRDLARFLSAPPAR